MNATNAKALNSMKQKLKKTQRDYDQLITKYKAVRPRFFPRDGLLTSHTTQDPEAFEREALAEDIPVAAPSKGSKKKSAAANAPAEGEDEDNDFQTVGVKGKTITISSEGIFKALAQVLEARGRKVRSTFECASG